MANFSFNALVAICAVKFKFRIPYATRKKTTFLKRLIKMHLFQPNAFPSKCMIILMFWKIVELTTKNYVDFFYFSYLTKSLCEFLFASLFFDFLCFISSVMRYVLPWLSIKMRYGLCAFSYHELVFHWLLALHQTSLTSIVWNQILKINGKIG